MIRLWTLENEKKVIGLREKLLESKNSQIETLTATVETAIKESVKTHSQTEECDEKPKPQSVVLLGKAKGKTDVTLPVLVKFRTHDIATGILRKSQGLRKGEKFKRVFVCTDRTVTERMEQRQLVKLMKDQSTQEKSQRYFIRND